MKKLAQALRWALAGLAFGLSPLYFMRVGDLRLFRVQLGLTEFGHWLALLALVLAVWPRGRAQSRPSAVACLAAALLFASPALRAGWLAPQLSREARGAWPLGPPGLQPAFSWKRLFFRDGRPATALLREEAVFDPLHGLGLTSWRQSAPEGRPVQRPYIVVCHGGGWDGGKRNDFPAWSQALAGLGYVVLDIDYRLAPASPWPAQSQDIAAARRYAKGNAARLGLDPSRCVLMGRSAGAHLVLASAYLKDDPGIKGVISFYGPADLFYAYQYGKPDDILGSLELLRNICGGTPESAKACYEAASPYLHVNARTPPTLLAHGGIDALVWDQQSIRLSGKLKEAGRPYQFVELPWATHGFDYNFRGPSGQLAWYSVQRFLATNLRK